MSPNGIKSSSGDCLLFQTTDGDWRVMVLNQDEPPETLYWNESLRDAMRVFGWATARKSVRVKRPKHS